MELALGDEKLNMTKSPFHGALLCEWKKTRPTDGAEDHFLIKTWNLN